MVGVCCCCWVESVLEQNFICYWYNSCLFSSANEQEWTDFAPRILSVFQVKSLCFDMAKHSVSKFYYLFLSKQVFIWVWNMVKSCICSIAVCSPTVVLILSVHCDRTVTALSLFQSLCQTFSFISIDPVHFLQDDIKLVPFKRVSAWHCTYTMDIAVVKLSNSLRFNGHFPGGPGLTGTRMSPFWFLLELKVMEVW